MDPLSLILDDIHLSGVDYLYVTSPKPWAFDLDATGLATFTLVLQGRATLELASGLTLALDAGDLVMVPGTSHRLRDIEGGAREAVLLNPLIKGHAVEPLILGDGVPDVLLLCARCRFDVGMSRPLIAGLPDHLVIRGVDRHPPEWLRIGLEFLGQEVAKNRPGRDAIINHLIGILFAECVRDYVDALPEGASSWLRALHDPALAAALAAIHGRPEYPWTVPELAALACLSRSAFAERFGDVLGVPPLSYLQSHRLRLAAWQLGHSDLAVGRIAEAVGYSSETAFSQAFKRQYSSTPSQYRQQHRSERISP